MLECLHKPRLFLIIDLLPFAKLLKLLVINHSLPEGRIIFKPLLLEFSCSCYFMAYMGAHVPGVELDNET